MQVNIHIYMYICYKYIYIYIFICSLCNYDDKKFTVKFPVTLKKKLLVNKINNTKGNITINDKSTNMRMKYSVAIV